MNRKVLAGTQALLNARENLFPLHRLYATCVHIGDALANLTFPRIAKVGPIEARRQCLHEFGTLARRELQGGFEQSGGIGHGPQCSRLGERGALRGAAPGGDLAVCPVIMERSARVTKSWVTLQAAKQEEQSH